MKEPASQKQKNPKSPSNKGLHDFAKYSGLAFQMLVIIAAMTWGGVKLDEVLGLSTPVFTIVLSLLGVFAGIYTAIKDFIKR
ncbi:MAG TPA: AtpZ/AtpI family protein [Bacteroidales bacterium]|jgi:F0F1-type ATP synthase assembly protein I|nr:ATPase F0F1 [Bacteroidales bacterium]HNR41977.1 AtpZ/AtpI family protein [Bacteroidales bacterium]HPM17626.1 AtpZ/AtpI family protein [Bacteroidales bacterium]HPV15755.1 AtpZ/AtpI family protein [Bacteroidales bacterium]HQG75888.1 AtpZ/AtpI family protein [Bacteroidales bacterium]